MIGIGGVIVPFDCQGDETVVSTCWLLAVVSVVAAVDRCRNETGRTEVIYDTSLSCLATSCGVYIKTKKRSKEQGRHRPY